MQLFRFKTWGVFWLRFESNTLEIFTFSEKGLVELYTNLFDFKIFPGPRVQARPRARQLGFCQIHR